RREKRWHRHLYGGHFADRWFQLAADYVGKRVTGGNHVELLTQSGDRIVYHSYSDSGADGGPRNVSIYG
ncbi:MAG: hypothetical protein QOG12_2037, partial [Verrucomicrobiota bacterium]